MHLPLELREGEGEKGIPALLPQVKWHKTHHAIVIHLRQQKVYESYTESNKKNNK